MPWTQIPRYLKLKPWNKDHQSIQEAQTLNSDPKYVTLNLEDKHTQRVQKLYTLNEEAEILQTIKSSQTSHQEHGLPDTSDSILGTQTLKELSPHILNKDPPQNKTPTSKLWVTDPQGDQISQTLNTDCKRLRLKPQDTDHQCTQRPHPVTKLQILSDSNVETHSVNDFRELAFTLSFIFCILML